VLPVLLGIDMAKSDDLVLMAVIGAPHGVRGELRAKPYTDDPLALGAYGPLQDDEGNAYTVLSVRPAKAVAVLRLKGIDSREAAEKLKGTGLYVPRAALRDDSLDDDEYFQADLEGLTVRDADGGRLQFWRRRYPGAEKTGLETGDDPVFGDGRPEYRLGERRTHRRSRGGRA
jgi:hypothetical protein